MSSAKLITFEDFTIPELDTGETAIVLQREGPLDTDAKVSRVFGGFLERLVTDGRKSLDVVVIGGEDELALNAASSVLHRIRQQLIAYNADGSQILNDGASRDGGPIVVSEIRGVDEASRIENFLSCTRLAANYHQAHSGRRLLMWMETGIDNLTPYLRRVLPDRDESAERLANLLPGFSFHVAADGRTQIYIGKNRFNTKIRHTLVTG
jgi:hypothetical protein